MGVFGNEINFTMHSEWSPKAPEMLERPTLEQMGWVYWRARCLICEEYLKWSVSFPAASFEIEMHLINEHREAPVEG